MIYAPVVKVVTGKVYADPGQDEALLDCYVHGEPKPTVRKALAQFVFSNMFHKGHPYWIST